MKQPDEARRDLVAQWLRKADDDLAAAEDLLAQARPYRWIICYHAQQAAEKYLKGFLVHRDVDPPKIHDLSALLTWWPR